MIRCFVGAVLWIGALSYTGVFLEAYAGLPAYAGLGAGLVVAAVFVGYGIRLGLIRPGQDPVATEHAPAGHRADGQSAVSV